MAALVSRGARSAGSVLRGPRTQPAARATASQQLQGPHHTRTLVKGQTTTERTRTVFNGSPGRQWRQDGTAQSRDNVQRTRWTSPRAKRGLLLCTLQGSPGPSHSATRGREEKGRQRCFPAANQPGRSFRKSTPSLINMQLYIHTSMGERACPRGWERPGRGICHPAAMSLPTLCCRSAAASTACWQPSVTNSPAVPCPLPSRQYWPQLQRA